MFSRCYFFCLYILFFFIFLFVLRLLLSFQDSNEIVVTQSYQGQLTNISRAPILEILFRCSQWRRKRVGVGLQLDRSLSVLRAPYTTSGSRVSTQSLKSPSQQQQHHSQHSSLPVPLTTNVPAKLRNAQLRIDF